MKYHGYGDDEMAVLCEGYVRNPEDGFWYFHQEIMPPPTRPTKQVGRLEFKLTLDAEPN